MGIFTRVRSFRIEDEVWNMLLDIQNSLQPWCPTATLTLKAIIRMAHADMQSKHRNALYYTSSPANPQRKTGLMRIIDPAEHRPRISRNVGIRRVS